MRIFMVEIPMRIMNVITIINVAIFSFLTVHLVTHLENDVPYVFEIMIFIIIIELINTFIQQYYDPQKTDEI